MLRKPKARLEITAWRFVKRAFDVIVSGSAIVGLSPLLAIIAIAVKLTSRGPILYSGVRVGRNGRVFDMLKFRTMVVDADTIGGSSTPDDDPRITGIGRILRRFKLDELPQLLNVVRGQMSIVGPRPQVEWAVSLYTDDERALLSVRPGITDYASILFANEAELLRGSRDPDRDYLERIAPQKIGLGLEYVRGQSLLLDLRIVAATLCRLLGMDYTWVLPIPAPIGSDERQTTTHSSGR